LTNSMTSDSKSAWATPTKSNKTLMTISRVQGLQGIGNSSE